MQLPVYPCQTPFALQPLVGSPEAVPEYPAAQVAEKVAQFPIAPLVATGADPVQVTPRGAVHPVQVPVVMPVQRPLAVQEGVPAIVPVKVYPEAQVAANESQFPTPTLVAPLLLAVQVKPTGAMHPLQPPLYPGQGPLAEQVPGVSVPTEPWYPARQAKEAQVPAAVLVASVATAAEPETEHLTPAGAVQPVQVPVNDHSPPSVLQIGAVGVPVYP